VDETAQRWPYFPVFLRLEGQRVLMVGGGEVALRKLRLLLRAGPNIRLIARELHHEVESLVANGRVRVIATEFDEAAVVGCALVIAATDDTALNARVAAAAEAQGIPVNVVDDAQLSSFVTPSILDRSPLMVAISTAGAAPILGRRLRARLETLIPTSYGRLARFMGERRARVQQRLPQAERRAFWERFLDGPGAEAIYAGNEEAAEHAFDANFEAQQPRGEVYLVGAGPGDPDLLSFRALRLMQQCDVVLYDALIAPAILELVRRDAERIYVGKRRARHTLPQEEINDTLVRLAREGKRVLRLKGGDPFVFGRGGEEIEQLAAQGIAFQVVPGITAANGCAAYAGIPLTHRDYAQCCIFLTGHARADGELQLDWTQLAKRGQTLAIYMGLNSLPQLCAKLIEHGLPPDWPAAIVDQGTSPTQKVVAATLADLPQRVAEAAPAGPSLTIVGEVVRLRERLRWFGDDA
jgi:uroporphyrin-III C-methyltransferase/precorrin-2 dehydrogenase/sirohydrochlorin ferrochelatase